jgi:hypothetical protein
MKLTPLRGSLVMLAWLLLAPAAAVNGQANKPAVEYQSLLNTRFYEADGGFLVDGLHLVFPPPGKQRVMFTISKAGGEEVVSLPLRVEPFPQFPAFGKLLPDGGPGVVKLGQSGDFVITIKAGGEALTTMPFTLKEETGADPFNPKKRFVREGPWREWAYLSVPVGDDVNPHVGFSWWMSLRELPAGMKRPLCTVHIMQGAQEIATGTGAVVPDQDDWLFYYKEFFQTKGAGKQYATLASLTGRDGEYAVVVKANGQPIKSYTMQVKGGQIQRPDQSRLGYEPHTGFISPRMIDTSSRNSDYQMQDTYWLRKSAK